MAGLASSGVDVLRLGVIPTPGVAYLTGALDADFGVVLSASHNPAADNGIKFFGRGGVKLPDEMEDEIEARAARRANGRSRPASRLRPGHRRVLRARDLPRSPACHVAVRRWPAAAARNAGSRGLRPRRRLQHRARARCAGPGAEVIAIGAAPDGYNINAGVGSTHLDDAGGGGRRARRRRGPRLRRRRGPLPGDRRRRRGRSTATRSSPCSRRSSSRAGSSPATPWWSR